MGDDLTLDYNLTGVCRRQAGALSSVVNPLVGTEAFPFLAAAFPSV